MLMNPFREFITIAATLNISKTADELYISQSNLSKHIKNLESHLGFQLLDRKGNSISLTPCGKTFADGIAPIVASYDELLTKCRDLYSMDMETLTVMDPPYDDEAAVTYVSNLRSLRHENKKLSFRFIPTYRINIESALNENEIDIGISYQFGDPNEIRKRFEERGISAKLLSPVHFSVFCKRSDPMSLQENVDFYDIENALIFTPNDECNITKEAIESLFIHYGKKPRFKFLNAESKGEFYATELVEGIFLLPSTMQYNKHFQLRPELTTIPLASELQNFFGYMITCSRNEMFFA